MAEDPVAKDVAPPAVLDPTAPPFGGAAGRGRPRPAIPNAPTGAAPMVGAASTMMTNPGDTMPIGTPPEMPADWRYTIHDEIARGGMGRVVEATDTVLGRTVAVKEALSLDPDAIARFQRETRITARLEHPSIVPVHDAGITPNGSPFYVMRKISGRPLEELVGSITEVGGRLALVPHIVAAAHAVAHAHERGIVHRDIKPANILVGDAGETIVIDWGLAKAIGETDEAERSGEPRKSGRSQAATAQVVLDDDEALKTRAGIVFGTPGFMAPEQLRGAPVDERGDVYALGATLYHLLARRPPHYSKVPGEMMRAAAEGPPAPLRELAPGVPPELATIVDKALAHDRAQRYQNAGGLADDLQRFLTGQLVASHHYSPRERIVRFVRQNRALVGVSITASLALIVGGSLAISRIVAARDQAADEARIAVDEKHVADAERAKAVDSLQQLTLTDARTKATEEPTRAVALVKPLVASAHWREARDVAAAARAQGVAFALPASPHTMSLELSRDGQRALAAGDDGIVRIYELGKRTSRTVGDAKAPVLARFGDAEHTVVWFRDNHITLVDVASGSHREVMTPTPIVKLEVSGPIAYWTDPQHAVWKLDLASGAPIKLVVDEPVWSVSPSPDGRWIALGGETHLLLVDRTAGTLPPEIIATGKLHEVAWAADGTHLAMLLDDQAIDLELDPSPAIIHRVTVGNRHGIAFSNGHMFTAGPMGISQVSRDAIPARATGSDYTLGVHDAHGDVVIAGRPLGVLVMSDDGDHMLSSPLRLARVEASSTGPYVVGATDNRLLVWNLDDVLARHVGDPSPNGAMFVTGDQLIVTYVDMPAEWIDLRTDKHSPLGMVAGGISELVPAPDGQRAIVIDGTHHGRLFAPVGEPVDLGDLDHAAFLDDRRLVLATPDGAIQLARQAPLVQRGQPIVTLAVTASDGGWIAAAFADHTLWRTNLEAKAATTLAVAATPARDALTLGPDGDVVFGAGNELRIWHADGTSAAVATFAKSIATIAYIDHAHVLVITSDGTAAVASTAHPGEVDPLAMPILSPSLGADGLLVAQTAGGVLEAIDPAAKERWPLAAPHGQQGSAQLSPDGRRVLAITASGVLVWPLALPRDPDATSHWIDTLTNAVSDHGPTAPLDWR